MSSDGNIIINENHVLHAVGTFATATNIRNPTCHPAYS